MAVLASLQPLVLAVCHGRGDNGSNSRKTIHKEKVAKDAMAKPDIFTFTVCTKKRRAGQGVLWKGSAGWHFTKRRELEDIQKILNKKYVYTFLCGCGFFFLHTYVYVISIKHQDGKPGIAIQFVPWDKKRTLG